MYCTVQYGNTLTCTRITLFGVSGIDKITKTVIFFIGLSRPPMNVALKSRGKTSLQVSWNAPEESLQMGELTGYQICFYTRDNAGECLVLKSTKVLSLTLRNLRPSTRYYVTVAASTSVGYGEKSLEMSKITNGGNLADLTIIAI